MVEKQFAVFWDWQRTSTFGLVWVPMIVPFDHVKQYDGTGRLCAAGTRESCESVQPLFAAD